MNDKINATFTLSSFYASDVKFQVKKFGDATLINDLSFSLTTNVEKIEDHDNQFRITYKVGLQNTGETLIIAADYHAIFITNEPITDELLFSNIIKVNASAIGFPYLRSFITQLSVNAGIAPIILPTINFTKVG